MMIQLFVSLLLLLVYFLVPLFWLSDTSATIRMIIGSAVVAFWFSFPVMLPIWNWQNTLTERRAAIIIPQLHAYQQQQGRYPDSLAQLVPQYLPKVPSTAEGLLFAPAFQYSTFSFPPDWVELRGQRVRHFWLSYYPGAMVEASYNSRSREWQYDD